ncbi:conjugal transfer protein TraD [Mesorhizobium sp. M1329]|uniref:conjugal transfer protein TraD n=1 Tax=Mesorhizobium sp. M1329 TaxID=2957083 RepID=UPI00333950FE
MRTWQVERRKRTRQLIELGGLVVKSRIVDQTGDDRATIYGAMIWMAEKLNSEDGGRARELWARKGKEAFDAERSIGAFEKATVIGLNVTDAGRRGDLKYRIAARHRG